MKKKKAKRRKAPPVSSIFTPTGRLKKTKNWPKRKPVSKIKARIMDRGRGKPLPMDDRIDIELPPMVVVEKLPKGRGNDCRVIGNSSTGM